MKPSVGNKKIRTYPPPPSVAKASPFPVEDHQKSQISLLDPTGSRTRLFNRENPDAPRVGDVLYTTFKTGDPFSGVCMNIRRQHVDTAILLRNKLMGVSVEMWIKIYSPNVRSVEVVKRAAKRARRARLYYLRNKKHDPSSVEPLVAEYLRKRRLIRSGGTDAKDARKVGMKPAGKKSAK
ncbi:uncharacterized protein KY384_005171 [Bacidia gigantensis]|uniref:uncharacterized protein n=1 Tax=Bacidia gigantensis TaxID=2732470 RepID=UPI001D05B700|nr:uncharacterized protein KY384_005171 [Bacidia gigantensis]KAG8529690.1 hypothetical protein KY384_005171 [Bacidia gigantensis]